MQSIAQDWLIFNLTHSSTAVRRDDGAPVRADTAARLARRGGGRPACRSGASCSPPRRSNGIATAALAVITITGAVRPGYV